MYLAHRKPRFGAANPERVHSPVWEWMVRRGINPYFARKELGLPHNYGTREKPNDPDWCFQRMGAARVALADGRTIWIGGEHEDWYDPDFCIYNDAVVRRGDAVEIYAYPREVFPPTDFHTATLIGRTIWIIGSLGYPEERGDTTPVFALDTETYAITRVPHRGPCPGWVFHHGATLQPDGTSIEVRGGDFRTTKDGTERVGTNRNTFVFDTATGLWSQTTDHSTWREFHVCYDENRAARDRDRSTAWYTGEILKELGYPVTLAEDDDASMLEEDPDGQGDRDDPDDEAVSSDADWRDRAHVLTVAGTRVRIMDRYGQLRVIVEGPLAQSAIDDLLTGLRRLLESSARHVTETYEV